jgi:hypothetical protein
MPQRFRDLEFPNEQLSTQAALNRLYQLIRVLKDKLFLVHNYSILKRPETWYLAQVSLDNTDPDIAKD